MNPLDSSLATARSMAAIPYFVPTSLLAAAEEALTGAARKIDDQVAQRPGRKGNRVLRATAQADWDAAQQVRGELWDRQPLSTDPMAALLASGKELTFRWATLPPIPSLEAATGLGVKQWVVAAAYAANGWSLTPDDLFMAAQATEPGEEPIDWRPWFDALRRERAQRSARVAEQRVQQHLHQAQVHSEAARQAAQAAAEELSNAQHWSRLIRPRAEVAALNEVELAQHEATTGGVLPADA